MPWFIGRHLLLFDREGCRDTLQLPTARDGRHCKQALGSCKLLGQTVTLWIEVGSCARAGNRKPLCQILS